jgi:hypothetical protein
MSEPPVMALPNGLPDEHGPLLLALASWRAQGTQDIDPIRFHHMEVLARRMATQPDAVRRILAGKLKAALADHGERVSLAQQAALGPGTVASHPGCTPLAQLNRYIRDATRASGETEPGSAAPSKPEMKSLGRFRATWARISADVEVDKAIGRGPDNAGPLNAHQLVLRSLTLMRGLSPDYLHRFMAQMDALLWLDQVSQKPTAAPRSAAPSRPVKPIKPKK